MHYSIHFKIFSTSRQAIESAVFLIQELSGRGAGSSIRVQASRFALKRSPHVFSKSQESFSFSQYSARVHLVLSAEEHRRFFKSLVVGLGMLSGVLLSWNESRVDLSKYP